MANTNIHFSTIAQRYKDLRTTDPEPILFIEEQLRELDTIDAADVGCGAGRYDLALLHHLGNRLRLRCLDANRNMLIENAKTMQDRCQSNASALQALADALPVTSNSLDVVLTFNAVHHFNLAEFIRESDRALKPGGLLFIYTRLRSQNKNSIWGKYFPAFHHKEDRLYEVDDFQQALRGVRRLTMERVKYFRYQRTEKFSRLTAQAAGRHYSTFAFYHAAEFERALDGFQESMKNHFDIQNGISWHDENVMFVFRKHDARPS